MPGIFDPILKQTALLLARFKAQHLPEPDPMTNPLTTIPHRTRICHVLAAGGNLLKGFCLEDQVDAAVAEFIRVNPITLAVTVRYEVRP